MSKLIALVFLALFISVPFTQAARLNPVDPKGAEDITEKGGNGCEGLAEEECLIRRTLNAHVDYIYTQHTPPLPGPHHP